jgi:hypothetical protein
VRRLSVREEGDQDASLGVLKTTLLETRELLPAWYPHSRIANWDRQEAAPVELRCMADVQHRAN